MLRTSRRILFAGMLLALPATLTLGGCASTEKSAADSAGVQSAAMMCPKCETVWVFDTERRGAGRVAYTSAREMTCPTCNKMADAYVKDGETVLHECPECKTTPILVTPNRELNHTPRTHK